jgi:hypothetical protein
MVVRVHGLVRAARRARVALRDGLEAGAAERFLADVRSVVGDVERALVERGAHEGRISPVSREALASLRRVAALSPQEIPAPREGAPPRPPVVHVTHVGSSLLAVADRLARARDDPSGVDGARRLAEDRAEAVAAICREAGGLPAHMPRRAARAYAMLRWLSDPSNAATCADRAAAAASVLARLVPFGRDSGSRSAGPLSPVPPPSAVVEPLVRFLPTRRVYRARRHPKPVVELHLGWLQASTEDFADLARRMTSRGRSAPDAASLARYRAFVSSREFGALDDELSLLLGGPEEFQARGRAYDLGALFERLDARHLKGAVARPRLHWEPSLSRLRYGLYVPARDLACVSARLDDARVPEGVAEFVLYHELLHKKHGAALDGRRVRPHTAAFRAEEALHPFRDEAERWMESLARGPTPDGDDPRHERDEPDTTPPAPWAPPAVGRPAFGSIAPAAEVAALRTVPRPGRNDPCSCGSGRKSKRCCRA